MFYKVVGKRFLDILFSFFGLIVLSPLLLVLAILIRVKLGKPIIFAQDRPGLNEKVFKMYKFRTMTNACDSDGKLLPDKDRLTSFGKFLRSTSLDELPELLNVFLGQMSLVGPRPQLIKDMIFMNTEQRRRHLVKPGITGLAQVNGRNNISWEDKFKYDLQYIENISFINDFKIVLKTIGKVFNRENVNREGTVSDIDFGDYLLENNKITVDEYKNKMKEIGKYVNEKRSS